MTDTSIWTPTMHLRWRNEPPTKMVPFSRQILQQMWRSEDGKEEWRDVPLDPYDDERLKAAIRLARQTVEPGNTMHSIWDDIGEAEALLTGGQMILKGSREELRKWLTDNLERFGEPR